MITYHEALVILCFTAAQLCSLPFIALNIMKLGTYGFYRGRENYFRYFKKRQESEDNGRTTGRQSL